MKEDAVKKQSQELGDQLDVILKSADRPKKLASAEQFIKVSDLSFMDIANSSDSKYKSKIVEAAIETNDREFMYRSFEGVMKSSKSDRMGSNRFKPRNIEDLDQLPNVTEESPLVKDENVEFALEQISVNNNLKGKLSPVPFEDLVDAEEGQTQVVKMNKTNLREPQLQHISRYSITDKELREGFLKDEDEKGCSIF